MFYNWQALIGGFAAIVAAIIAGAYVRQQIVSNEKQEAARLRRREAAVRAVLPLTLTKFTDFAEECAGILRAISDPMGGVPIDAPEIPQQAITDLERAIEAAGDTNAVEVMSKLASHAQVLHSIIEQIVADCARGSSLANHRSNMPAFRIRVSRVYAAASGLFEWARGEAQAVDKVSWDDIKQAILILNIDDDQTMEMVAKNLDQGAMPLDW